MRILMLGWEFPPFIAGGLGVACYGLTRALDRHGHEITFVLPRPIAAINQPATRTGALTPPGTRAAKLPDGVTVLAPGNGAPNSEPIHIPRPAPTPAPTPAPAAPAPVPAPAPVEPAPLLAAAPSLNWDPPRMGSAGAHDAPGGPVFTGDAEIDKRDLRDPRGSELFGFDHTRFLGVPTPIDNPYGSLDAAALAPAAAAVASWLRPTGAPTRDPYAHLAELSAQSLAMGQRSAHTAAPPATPAGAMPIVTSPAPPKQPPQPPAAPIRDSRQPAAHHDAGAYHAMDLIAETDRYARMVVAMVRHQRFDVVHAHDWLTFPAAIAVANALGVPFVAHVHSTEFDRAGSGVSQRIYDIERAGMHAADRVIAVSQFTKSIITRRYTIDANKIDVVHNGIDRDAIQPAPGTRLDTQEKIVLFLGRITVQKGPEYFLAAARRVLSKMPNVRFVLAGAGDMALKMIELANSMGIGKQVLFTGFLKGDDVERVFRMADCYVMPSVSEPFGIAALEAISHDVPVIISKTSGASEVLRHVLKVDFWDIDDMANKILAVLRYPPLASTLREHGTMELRRLTWDDAAAACEQAYRSALAPRMAARAVEVST
jgi:glycosyltransferase involved in cell wall biosynthesis